MSGLQKCGFCDLLFGLLRRFMCARNRRGSVDTCYRELGGENTVRFDDRPHEIHCASSAQYDTTPQTQGRSFAEELSLCYDDDMAGLKKKKQLTNFYTCRRRCRASAESAGPHAAVTDDRYYAQAELLLSRSASWEFDTYLLDRVTGGHCIPALGMHLFTNYDLIKHFRLLPENCWKLFNSIERLYHAANPYHNSIHAADVTQAVHCFLQQPQLLNSMEKLEVLVVILAALTHDLDHPGVSGSYLEATGHPLAVMFKEKALGINDRSPIHQKKKGKLMELFASKDNKNEARSSAKKQSRGAASSSGTSSFFWRKKKEQPCDSILEFHHWRVGYSCILQSGILAHMPEQLPQVQKMLKSLILATDITRQNIYLGVFKRHLEQKTIDMRRAEHRMMILQMALKTADISNPGRPWSVSKIWSHKVCDEFFHQGDCERRRNLPISKLCDRHSDNVPAIQTGFYQYIVTPLYTEWHRYLKSELSLSMMTNLVHNAAEWGREAQRSKTNTEITPADQVQYSLETSTVVSSSTEMLLQEAGKEARKAPRRSSYSPVRASVKDTLRRYSAPLHTIIRRERISEVILREDIHPGWRPPPPADYNPSMTRSQYSNDQIRERREVARSLSQIEAVVQDALHRQLSAGDCHLGAMQVQLGTFRVVADSYSSTSQQTLSTTANSNVLPLTASASASVPSSSGFNGRLDDFHIGSMACVVGSVEGVGCASGECRDVVRGLGGRRRGSAPTTTMAPSPRRMSASSCHQWLAESAPVRRGSLPIEVMAGISAL